MTEPNVRLRKRMKQQEWLVQYIADAFAGVQLGDGIDIHAAASLDDDGNPEEDRLSRNAERHDWRRVPSDVLFSRHIAVTFLDVAGFRFYAPAIMTSLIQHGDQHGLLSEWFLSDLKVTIHGKIKGVDFNELFTKSQRAAIVRFLNFLIHHNNRGWKFSGDAESRLREIQTRT